MAAEILKDNVPFYKQYYFYLSQDSYRQMTEYRDTRKQRDLQLLLATEDLDIQKPKLKTGKSIAYANSSITLTLDKSHLIFYFEKDMR